MELKNTLNGFGIVVLDRGFIYVGDVTVDERFVTIKNARNIRYWGTERGLGQLAIEGPNANTKLDDVGTVIAPLNAMNSIIDTSAEKWKK